MTLNALGITVFTGDILDSFPGDNRLVQAVRDSKFKHGNVPAHEFIIGLTEQEGERACLSAFQTELQDKLHAATGVRVDVVFKPSELHILTSTDLPPEKGAEIARIAAEAFGYEPVAVR